MTPEEFILTKMMPTEPSWRLVKDGKVICFLQRRSDYCDRGRYHLILHTPIWQSDADQGVRYYFDLERAKAEVEDYMKAKEVPIEGAVWEIDTGDKMEVFRYERRKHDTQRTS